MSNREQQLQQQARGAGTLIERLQQSRARIAKMCADRRGPRMSIPVEAADDDFFICLALEDAIDALNAAQPPKTGALKLDTDCQVFFYEQDHYYLSNFSAFRVRLFVDDGSGGEIPCSFDTTEAAYHWFKFPGQPELQAYIRAAQSAHDAFKLAERNRDLQRPDWDAVKVDIMRDILRAKVQQHAYVRRKLLETGNRILIENSWRDDYWGWGENRDGQNMLGKLWMEIRAELRQNIEAVAAALTTQTVGGASHIAGKDFDTDLAHVLEIKQAHRISTPAPDGAICPAYLFNRVREHCGVLLSFIDKLWTEYSKTLQQFDDCTARESAIRTSDAICDHNPMSHGSTLECDAQGALKCSNCTSLDAPTAAPPVPSTDELKRKLAAAGVFKGAEGLEGLLNAREFWEQQSYGTRLYYGPGIADYLHRGVLAAAVKILKETTADTRDAARYRWIRKRDHADIASCWLLPNSIDCDEGPEAFDAAIDEAMKLGEQQSAPEPQP